MANAIVTIKIMPESPEIDLAKIEEQSKKEIIGYAGEGETKTEIDPIAFCLKALKIIFVVDEAKGSPEVVAEKVQAIEGVNSCEVSDVRRAIG